MTAWNMNASKGKPGGQGSLFSVGDKDALLNPQQRWPKGYSPERRDDIREVVDRMGITISGPGHIVRHTEAQKQADPLGRYAVYPEAENRVIGHIARSTVPAFHLEGLSSISNNTNEGQSGTYWPSRRALAYNQDRDTADRTLIHELGHHESNMAQTGRIAAEDIGQAAAVQHRTRHEEAGSTLSPEHFSKVKFHKAAQVSRGVEEAVADKYYMEHYRGPGRKRERATQGRYEDTGHADNEVYKGYRDVIPKKHMGPQFSQEALF